MHIAIVGAGISGLMAGWFLARAGVQVDIFEKLTIGSGCSGKALGVLIPSALMRPVDAFQREGVDMWPRLADELATTTRTRREDFFIDWDGRYRQLRLPYIFDVLRDAFERHGGVVREDMPVTDIDLLTKQFDGVLLAAGCANAEFGVGNIQISAGQALRLRPKQPMQRLLSAQTIFVVPDWDGTVLVGPSNWDVSEEGDGRIYPAKTNDLMARAQRIAPELEDAEIIEQWVGYRPQQAPRLPLVFEVSPKVWAVAGLGKVGYALAPIVGREAVRVMDPSK